MPKKSLKAMKRLVSKPFIALIWLVWGLMSVCHPLQAQQPLIKSIKRGKQVIFYAQNPNYCPYQVSVLLKNPEVIHSKERQRNYFYILPAQQDSIFLFELELHASESTLQYVTQHHFGNPEEVKPETDYAYLLPYIHQSRYFLLQAYNGKFSHRRQYALDFKMKEGSAVCAAREGTVIAVKKDSDKGGKTAAFAQEANYIIIYHRDGTFAYYYHLQQNGAAVSVGDRVNAGQVIGLSGNTGWSTTPHLHFVVKKPQYQDMVSIPTAFITRPRKIKTLCKWRKYKAYHPK